MAKGKGKIEYISRKDAETPRRTGRRPESLGRRKKYEPRITPMGYWLGPSTGSFDCVQDKFALMRKRGWKTMAEKVFDSVNNSNRCGIVIDGL
jgi:hypothetical protein